MATVSGEVPPDYAYETCGLCNGVGKGGLGPNEPCPPCKATGKVLVHQPPIRCPRCGGDGKAKQPFEGIIYSPVLCVICLGAGWVMVRLD
jgi:DnaJ-class molecular chaperone